MQSHKNETSTFHVITSFMKRSSQETEKIMPLKSLFISSRYFNRLLGYKHSKLNLELRSSRSIFFSKIVSFICLEFGVEISDKNGNNKSLNFFLYTMISREVISR